MPNERKTVMISSTVRDLPEHRKEVMDACLRQGMFPIMMEHLPANDDEAISTSFKMVDEADIYVGVYAQRYGYIPKGKKRNPKQISVTEMEYDRAVKRKIPRLIFIMDKTHPITINDIDIKNAAKLEAFKDRVQNNNIVNFFRSSTDLRSHVINSLSKYLEASPIPLIKKELPAIDLGTYYEALRKRFGVLALEGLTPPQKEEYLQIHLHSVFVEQSVRENSPPVELPKGVWEKLSRDNEIHSEDLPSGITLDDVRKARESYFEKPSRLVLDVLSDSPHKYAIILGDPGSGKSTLARYVLLSLIDPAGDEKLRRTFDAHIPLLIELRSYAGLCADGTCTTFLELLEYLGKTEGWALKQTSLHNYLKNDGRAVVIFDGLDEIFDPEQREQITRQIVGFCNDYPKARVIVTSRVIGYRRKILTDAGFTHFTLQDFDQKQVESFVAQWYDLALGDRPNEVKERRERILKSFRDSPSIRQLAGNPMLLTIMTIIGKHQELPRERWKLYDHAASVLIQHWDVNKHLKDESIEADFVGEDDKKELLRRLAFNMQSGDAGLAGNYIHRDILQSEFENYLIVRYNQSPDKAKIISEAMIRQFRERNFILSLYGATLYGFVHRAFLEYFCASAFVWKFEKTRELTIEQLMSDVYGKHWEDQSWHEVLRLSSGMIAEKWTEKILTYLISDTFQPQPEEFDIHIPWNILLAIDCLKEVRNPNIFANTAEQILLKVCSLFEHSMRGGTPLFDFLDTKVIPSLEEVKPEWPNRGVIVQWLRDRPSNKNSFLMYAQLFSRFVYVMGHGLADAHQEILNYSSHSDSHKRLLATTTLSSVWKDDPKTFQILSEFAKNDSDLIVRLVAIDCLGRYFKEYPLSFELIRNIASGETNSEIRSLAIETLGRTYTDDSSVLDLIISWAISSDKDLRSAALSTLGKFFSDLPKIRKFLWNIVLDKNDPDGHAMLAFSFATSYRNEPQAFDILRKFLSDELHFKVRSAAAWAIGTRFNDDARAYELLKQTALFDKSSEVRSTAIAALEYFPQTPELLDVIKGFVRDDHDALVRSAAISLLASRFLNELEVVELILERAVNDPSPSPSDANDKFYPREAAITLIAEYLPNHPSTLPLLRERTENDPTPWLRESAKELLSGIENK